MRLPAMAARESHTISQASVSEESISVLLAGSVAGVKAAIGDRVRDAVCCRSQRVRTSRSDLVGSRCRSAKGTYESNVVLEPRMSLGVAALSRTKRGCRGSVPTLEVSSDEGRDYSR